MGLYQEHLRISSTIESECVINSHGRLEDSLTFRRSIALDMANPLPSSLTSLNRWLAEPTQFIFLPSQAFIPNAKGYPVLSKACQTFIRGFARVRELKADLWSWLT